MIVLSYGMTKSGSTLAFELCKAILEQRGFPQRTLPDDVVAPGRKINFINRPAVGVLRRLLEAVEPDEIIAIKIHATVGDDDIRFIENQIAKDRIKVQVNLRDPREICLSLVDAGAQARAKGKKAFAEVETLDDAAEQVNHQLVICRRWGAIKGAQFLYYNDVAFEPEVAMRQICAQFGFPVLNAEEYRTVHDRVFDEVFTQKNKGIRDRHKAELSEAQNAALLERLDYGKDYVTRVFEQKDFSWFAEARKA